ncbi:hypothetical protein [Nostoc sp.]|uniref:hypothetical protein n=1 Tax=Nostoc sp. TaxID=1180 RepID=UPI002FF543FE
MQGDALVLSADALVLSADALALSADALALSADALALQGIAKFNSLQINEMLYLVNRPFAKRLQELRLLYENAKDEPAGYCITPLFKRDRAKDGVA